METGLRLDSVIFGTDFSDTARISGQYAAHFARFFGVQCIVAHAFTLVQPAMEAEALDHVRSEQRLDAERGVFETVEALAPLAGRAVGLLQEGRPIDVLRATSEQHEPSLIVLGTHGGGTLQRHTIGSVAEEILRTVCSPIVTVGPHVAAPSSSGLALRRILYATDFSPASAHAAPYATALARAFGANIDLLHVVPDGALGEPEQLRVREEAFHGALHRLVPDEAAALRVSRTFVEPGAVSERIAAHARQDHIDLIVMGAHHHSWFARHFRTGPAFQIILSAACPVLTTCA